MCSLNGDIFKHILFIVSIGWSFFVSCFSIAKDCTVNSLVLGGCCILTWLTLILIVVIYSQTRRQSLLQTSAVSLHHWLTLKGIWGCFWASTPPTWPRAPPCPQWRLNVQVGSWHHICWLWKARDINLPGSFSPDFYCSLILFLQSGSSLLFFLGVCRPVRSITITMKRRTKTTAAPWVQLLQTRPNSIPKE